MKGSAPSSRDSATHNPPNYDKRDRTSEQVDLDEVTGETVELEDAESGDEVKFELGGEEYDGRIKDIDDWAVTVIKDGTEFNINKENILQIQKPKQVTGISKIEESNSSQWITRDDTDNYDSIDDYTDTLEAFAEANGINVSGVERDFEKALHTDVRAQDDQEYRTTDSREGSLPDIDFEDIEDIPDKPKLREINGNEVYVGSQTKFLAEANSLFERERAGYRFLVESGVNTVPHEFELEEKVRAKQSVEGEVVSRADPNTLHEADSGQAKDVLAMHMVGGDFDPHDLNIAVTDDGDVVSIDLDRMGDDMDDQYGGYEHGRGWNEGLKKAANTYQLIEPTLSRDEAREQIHNRARELATEMMETGKHRSVINSVAEIDERAAKHIAKNITALATKTDNAPESER